MTPSPLGEFEVVVLMAVLHLQRSGEAFGSAVRTEIESRSGRRVPRGSIYVTLDRLEEKGLLSSSTGGATPQRHGRAKRLFKLTPRGKQHLKNSVALLARMHKGLEPILGEL